VWRINDSLVRPEHTFLAVLSWLFASGTFSSLEKQRSTITIAASSPPAPGGPGTADHLFTTPPRLPARDALAPSCECGFDGRQC
jgi:hypothetical protein